VLILQGADISNACNEGALIAARRKSLEVTMKDLENALDRVIGGSAFVLLFNFKQVWRKRARYSLLKRRKLWRFMKQDMR
jgi:hypothetical protein